MSNHSCMLSCHSYNWENGFWRSWSEWWEEWPLAQSRKCFAHSRRVSAGYRFSHASSSNLAEDASMRAEWRRWHTRSCTLCGREIGLTHNTLPGALLASLISDRIPQGKWSGWTVRESRLTVARLLCSQLVLISAVMTVWEQDVQNWNLKKKQKQPPTGAERDIHHSVFIIYFPLMKDGAF